MKFFQKHRKKPAPLLTPFIDVLFVLIIFFAVSSQIIDESGIGLKLPQSKQSEAEKIQIPTVIVKDDGTLWFQNQKLNSQELQQKIARLMKDQPNSPIALHIDKRTQHGKTVFLMSLLKEVGAKRIIFGTIGE